MDDEVNCVKLSPDGESVCSACLDGKIRITDFQGN